MLGRKQGRAIRAARRLVPAVDGLDRRELMAAGGIAQSLGPFVGPAKSGLKAGTAKTVNPHNAVQGLLASILGPGTEEVQARGELAGSSPAAVLRKQVLGQPFLRSVLSNADTYALFGTAAFNGLIGSQQVSGTTPSGTTGTATNTSTSTTTPGGAPIPRATATGGTSTTSAPQDVAFAIPTQATIRSITGSTTLIQVNASGGVAGFFAEVPTSNVRILDEGPPITGSVTVPAASIPAGFPTPDTTFLSNGTFSATYAATGPLLSAILDSGVVGVAPNAPKSVPGLRLAPFLLKNNAFPSPAARKELLKGFRLAIQRDVFTLSDAQQTRLSDGLTQFSQQVQALLASRGFTPAIPLAPPLLPAKPLAGTLAVSAGVVRRLVGVDPSVTGLQLEGLGNFPGRLDVGYVFDRAGNFGVQVTLRGALTNANPGLRPGNIAVGDVRVEVSNAPSINALTGRRLIEGVGNGALVATDLESSVNDSGVATFAASAGNGFGVEYGTGVGYTAVIPLGNVYSLIPSAPLR